MMLNFSFQVYKRFTTRLRNHHLNSRGMNIAYITVGLAIMSIVGMSAAYLVGDVKKQEVAGNAMGALNQAHILSLQKAKNTETVRNALTANGYDITKGSNLYKCLGGVGLACQGFCGSTCDATHLEYKPITNFVANTVIPGGLSVNSTASFGLFCNSNSCDYVSIKVKSQLSGGASSSPFANIARESEFQLPGVFLTDRAQLSFDCAKTAANKIPTGIDLKKLGAICNSPQPTTEQCAGNPTAPVGQFLLTSSNPGCPVTNNLDCSSTGVAAIGAMNLAGARGYCVGAAPVVTTTTAATVTTTTVLGATTTTSAGPPTTVMAGPPTTAAPCGQPEVIFKGIRWCGIIIITGGGNGPTCIIAGSGSQYFSATPQEAYDICIQGGRPDSFCNGYLNTRCAPTCTGGSVEKSSDANYLTCIWQGTSEGIGGCGMCREVEIHNKNTGNRKNGYDCSSNGSGCGDFVNLGGTQMLYP